MDGFIASIPETSQVKSVGHGMQKTGITNKQGEFYQYGGAYRAMADVCLTSR